jgi:hypothetical protein
MSQSTTATTITTTTTTTDGGDGRIVHRFVPLGVVGRIRRHNHNIDDDDGDSGGGIVVVLYIRSVPCGGGRPGQGPKDPVVIPGRSWQ